MSVIGSSILAGASGAAGGGSKVYVDDVFSTFVYTGNGTARSINNGIDLAGEGGLVWIKNRDNGYQDHVLNDTERGAGQTLRSDSANAQFLSTARFSAFNSNGFSVGTDSGTNNNNEDIVSWTFRKAPGFFDVVTWVGNDVVGRQIPHSLGSVPGMIIVKAYNTSSESWHVYHRSLGSTKYLLLNSTNAENTGVTVWNSTTPTSTHFTLANNNGTNGFYNYVAYVFAHDDAQFGTDEDESIIKCGSYTGSSSGVNINLGFEPQWVMVKRTNGSGSWYMMDTMRGFTASNDPRSLKADSADAEGGISKYRITSTGFDWNSDSGDSGQQYVYMAIRRPNKPPETGAEVFAIDYGDDSSTIPCFNSVFPVDFAIRCSPALNGNDHRALSRLQGKRALFTSSAVNESTDNDTVWDSMAGYGKGINNNFLSYMFKRAPGFMDVVAYSGTVTGNSDSQTVPHNLGVTPELMLVKRRTGSTQWYVYSDALTNPLTQKLVLNDSGDASATSNAWGTSSSPTAPNANNFTVGYATGTGWVTAGDFVAYLFATLPGISKVGSYSGYSSNAVDVNCGFAAGARFILIKRTNSPGGNWYVWDTTRGIVSGNDPYLVLDDAVPQVTNTDYIDPLTTGFTVTASAPAALNATGGTYIFLAIA